MLVNSLSQKLLHSRFLIEMNRTNYDYEIQAENELVVGQVFNYSQLCQSASESITLNSLNSVPYKLDKL